ncbi:putative pyridoxine 5'-phosphate oxidase superfamily flavin-nucleotide-binding protein [Luteibacter sp. W1I16]|uniref:pyridoxamine 5'-phosphate oxidase family protein n=1 Tax=Luteibacter sp. W1I16 TaxID=3373922 RepID=UPI003D1CB098
MTASLKKLPTWHEGETFIQEKVGVAERMAAVGQRAVRDFMPDQHRAFYEQLPFVVLGSVDAHGDPWATLLAGTLGFMSSPNPTTLDIALRPDPTDPASEGVREGEAIGLLGIEMHTRRRNRMNGFVAVPPAGSGFRVDVDQSFGKIAPATSSSATPATCVTLHCHTTAPWKSRRNWMPGRAT